MKRHWVLLLKLVISATLLGFVISQIDLGEILKILNRITATGVAALLLVGAMQIVLHIHRWQLVSRVLGTELQFRLLARLTLIGLFFNQAMPTSFGGDAIRIAMVRRYCPSLSRAVAGVLLDRVIALVALVGIVAIVLPFLSDFLGDPALTWSLWIVVSVGVASMGFVIGFGATGERLLARVPIIKGAGFFLGDFRRSLSSPRLTPPVAMYAVATHMLTCVIIFTLAREMTVPLSFLECLLLVPVIILLSAVPISFAGWGVRESATVYLLGQVGVAAPDALAISFAFGLLLIALGVPGGLICLIKLISTDPGNIKEG
jgi:hypothetical protein